MVIEYAEDYTISELMACFIARQLEDWQDVGAGAALAIPGAAALLAHLTHGPNMSMRFGYCQTNMLNVPVVESTDLSTDYRPSRWAEYYNRDDEYFAWVKWRRHCTLCLGAIQIDKYGNSNMVGVGDDYRKLKFRGPGPIGTTTVGDHMKNFILVVNSHSKRIFVEKCDFISLVGWGEGGRDAREKLSLPGGGPIYCVTPLCIMDFEEETKRMRLKSIHPGVTAQEVAENTGFQLIVPKEVLATEPPTKEELEILRTRIDPTGLILRRQ